MINVLTDGSEPMFNPVTVYSKISPDSAKAALGCVIFFTRTAARRSGSYTSIALVTTWVKKNSPPVVCLMTAETALFPM